MMKLRLLSLAVAAVLCAGFVSCGDDDEEPQNPAIGNAGGESGNGSDNAGGDNGSDNNGGNAGGTIELVGAVADAVDLGLPSGTLWASWNVGATAPEEYGGYYAWGEIEEKNYYDWTTYKWCNGSASKMTKYCTESGYGIVDNKILLEPGDDVAHMMWGDGWRMPTHAEINELYSNCKWEKSINGYKLTSNSNGNSIILPASGYHYGAFIYSDGSVGIYWCNTLYSGSSGHAWALNFYGVNYYDVDDGCRFYGRSVRPVKGK